MKTLQEILVARSGARDKHAAHAVLDVQGGRVRYIMSAIGDLPRVVLSVSGNDISVVQPSDLYRSPNELADAEADVVQRHMTPDNVQPGSNLPPNAFALGASLADGGQVQAIIRDGRLFAGEGGPEILPPAIWPGAPAVDTQTGQPIERPTSAGGEPVADENLDQSDNGEEGGDGGQEGGDNSTPKPIDHTKFSRDELVELAAKEKVEIAGKTNKADIAAAINTARGIASDS